MLDLALGKNYCELFAAESGREKIFTEVLSEQIGQRENDLITLEMAIFVIDFLEIVYIDNRQSQIDFCLIGQTDQFIQRVHEDGMAV